jgi:hypothetical protein
MTVTKTQNDAFQALWLSPAKDMAQAVMTELKKRLPNRTQLDYTQRFIAAWPVIYSLKWTEISDVSGFEQNSTHCRFAKLFVSHNKQNMSFFMKIAPRDMVLMQMIDNPMTDSVNGKILRRLIQAVPDNETKRKLQAHTIMYETSFNCPITKHDSLPLQKMAHLDNEECPFSTHFPRQQKFEFASVFEYIPGESVSDLLEEDPNGMYRLLDSLPEFWEAMGVLGMDYGMLHNDLHAGNVFYNSRSQKLVLIDYGQMSFPDEIQNTIGESLNDIAENEAYRNKIKPLSYQGLIGKRVVATKKDAHFYTAHILDLATFMMNVYLSMSMSLEPKWQFFNELIKFDQDGEHMQINLNVASCITEWYNAMMSINKSDFLSPVQKRGMHLIGEGIFFMCMLMNQVLIGKGWLTPFSQTISREFLASERLVHWGFQINRHVVEQFVNTTHICRTLLHEMSKMNAHLVAYLFHHSILLKKMKTPNPSHHEHKGGNKRMPASHTEPTAKEWVHRYKYLQADDIHDDASLQSLAKKDRNHMSITSQSNSSKVTSPSPKPVSPNTILRPSFSVSHQQPLLAHGGRKKRTRKVVQKHS